VKNIFTTSHTEHQWDVLRSNEVFRWISFLFILLYFICFLNWCSMGFIYPFISISISISIWSFRYCSLVCFFWLFPFYCLSFFLSGGEKGHAHICAHLHWYMCHDLKTLQEEHTIRALVLVSHKCLKSTPNPTPLPLAHYTTHRPLLMKRSMFK
jgi:hypothetical protein